MLSLIFYLLIIQNLFTKNITYGDELANTTSYDDNWISSRLSFSVNASLNFFKYACGNIKEYSKKVEYHKYFKPNQTRFQFITEYVQNTKNLTPNEVKVKKFLESCHQEGNLNLMFEQIEILKKIGNWPTYKNFSSKDIAHIIANVPLAADNEILGLVRVSREKYILRPGYTFPIDSLKNFETNLEISEEEFENIEKQLLAFHSKLYALENLINYNHSVPVESIDNLQNVIPSFDWEEYFNVLRSKYNIDLKKVYWYPDLVKATLDLVNSTKSSIVINYFTYKYIEFMSGFKCKKNPYFTPFYEHKLLKKYATTDNIKKYNQLFDIFDQTFQLVTSNMTNMNIKPVKDKIELSKYFLNNYDEIFVLIYSKLYDSVISPDTYYSNLFNFLESYNKFHLNKREDKLITRVIERLDRFEFFDIDSYEKPILYHFATMGNHLWKIFFKYNSQYNDSGLDECEINYIGASDILKELQHIKAGLLTFLMYTEINLSNLEDPIASYYLALSQEHCKRGTRKNDIFFKALQMSREFKNSFALNQTDKFGKIMECGIKNCIGKCLIGNELIEDSLLNYYQN